MNIKTDMFEQLNKAQRKAINNIEGPLLVIAGPGTGKTQLLSARVANILQNTDTLPQNILCLTFTESAAQNMRERLSQFIGQAAYDVTISTYHTFGSDIIRRHPEFFEELRLDRPIDDLRKRQVLTEIVDKLSYQNPLKSTQYHIGDLMSTVSELKRGLFTPQKLRSLAQQNIQLIEEISPAISTIFKDIKRMPSKADASIELFEQVAAVLADYQSAAPHHLGTLGLHELLKALDLAKSSTSSKPLTAWKNAWLYKDANNRYVFTEARRSLKLSALADVLEQYRAKLSQQGLYDFDDMILRSIDALETHDELRFNVQESYLYVLLDEFQDTNAAQLKLVQLLTDNPVHEGRPNVMAVGDDDQAIYAFQGAEVSNMIHFAQHFRDTPVITLTENYRSHSDIIATAEQISKQIEFRLHDQLDSNAKQLTSVGPVNQAKALIERHTFATASQELHWIATSIQGLLKKGTAKREVVVLAPKHRYLEMLVPYLNHLGIPVHYEKRENILEAPVIKQLRIMAELVLAIAANDTATANRLYPVILSWPWYDVPVQTIWQTNWLQSKRSETRSWAEIATENTLLSNHVWFFQTLALQLEQRTLESILDVFIGTEQLEISGMDTPLTSPLKHYYFTPSSRQEQPLEYYETLSQLSVIRATVREHQAAQNKPLTLHDFLQLFQLYELAEQPLLNTHPINQAVDAVQLLTTFKAKGLEFEHVYLLHTTDEVWGMSARRNQNRLTLPANMQWIRHAGANQDEQLRLLYVALTRAKTGLFLTSHHATETGKATKHLKYLDETVTEDGQIISKVLPEGSKTAQHHSTAIPTLDEELQFEWHARHIAPMQPSLKALLQKRLDTYQMSPTHLNSYIDLYWGGPETFFLHTILRFPAAPTVDGEYGNAVHETLDWYQKQTATSKMPITKDVLTFFSEALARRYVPTSEMDLLLERGSQALSAYLTQRSNIFSENDASEVSFKNEGVFVDEAHLTGNIDRLEIDKASKTITVVDFKTGRSYDRWKRDLKLLKYRQQLYFYKLLVERSHTYANYRVEKGRLEFVEPNDEGQIVSLELEYDAKEMAQLKRLIAGVWQHIKSVEFPNTAQYGTDIAGVKDFINTLSG